MLTRPYNTLGGRTWWNNVEETAELVAQSHRTPSLWWGNPHRVIVKDSGLCIAEAPSLEGLMETWKGAKSRLEDAKRSVGVLRLTAWIVGELFTPAVEDGWEETVGEAALMSETVPTSSTTTATSTMTRATRATTNSTAKKDGTLVGKDVLEAAVSATSWSQAIEVLRGACLEGADWWNAHDAEGQCVLHLALEKGNQQAVRKLLGQGSNVHCVERRNGWGPLHVACIYCVPACQALLDRHAWVMQPSNEGFTPLHYLMRQPWSAGVQEVCTSLIDAGAQVDVVSYGEDTPLSEALGRGNVHGALHLLEKRAAKVTEKAVEAAFRGAAPIEAVAVLRVDHEALVRLWAPRNLPMQHPCYELVNSWAPDDFLTLTPTPKRSVPELNISGALSAATATSATTSSPSPTTSPRGRRSAFTRLSPKGSPRGGERKSPRWRSSGGNIPAETASSKEQLLQVPAATAAAEGGGEDPQGRKPSLKDSGKTSRDLEWNDVVLKGVPGSGTLRCDLETGLEFSRLESGMQVKLELAWDDIRTVNRKRERKVVLNGRGGCWSLVCTTAAQCVAMYLAVRRLHIEATRTGVSAELPVVALRLGEGCAFRQPLELLLNLNCVSVVSDEAMAQIVIIAATAAATAIEDLVGDSLLPHQRVVLVVPLCPGSTTTEAAAVPAAGDLWERCCVLQTAPTFGQVFHQGQWIRALGHLHLPIEDSSTLLPLVSELDVAQCVVNVAVTEPVLLYFPGRFTVSGVPLSMEVLCNAAAVLLDQSVHRAVTLCPVVRESTPGSDALRCWNGHRQTVESDVPLLLGRFATPLPEYLHKNPRALQVPVASLLIQDLEKRWQLITELAIDTAASVPAPVSSVEVMPLAENTGGGGNTAPPSPPPIAMSGAAALAVAATPLSTSPVPSVLLSPNSGLANAFSGLAMPSPLWSRADSVMQAFTANGWMAAMLCLQWGPGEEWVFGVLCSSNNGSSEVLQETFVQNLVAVRQFWEQQGIVVGFEWQRRVTEALFGDQDRVSLPQWLAALPRVRSLLRDADSVGGNPAVGEIDIYDSDGLVTVGPGHAEWPMLQALLMATRLRMSESHLLPAHALRTPGSPLVSMSLPMGWTVLEPMPNYFRRIRDLCGLDTSEVTRWLGPTQLQSLILGGRLGGLQEVPSHSRSGSLFFRSCNGRFLVKTIPPHEDQLLLQHLPDYVDYLEKNPDSALPRYLLLLRLHGPSGRSVSFLVMLSVFGTAPICEQYDLKGSTLARHVGGPPNRLVALKDLDLQRVLHIGSRPKAQLLGALERDSHWLYSRNVCDYSLLVGICKLSDDDDGTSMVKDAPIFGACSTGAPREVFFMGLIDTLTQYDMRKRSEHVMKSIVHDSTKISAVEPRYYRIRFLKYIASILQ